MADGWVAGVDGCPGGWIAAFRRRDRLQEPRLRIFDRFRAILEAPEQPEIVAVDMPIGLPERLDGSGRAAEVAVRSLLGARQSSVFSIPARMAVYAPDYLEACRLASACSVPPRKVSKQAFHIFPKIREIDALLREELPFRGRVFEAHPEMAFRCMNRRPLSEPKKVKGVPYPAGIALRRGLLAREGFPVPFLMAKPPRGAAIDDVLDACATLVVAEKIAQGLGRPFPDPPPLDGFGLPMAIWAWEIEALLA